MNYQLGKLAKLNICLLKVFKENGMLERNGDKNQRDRILCPYERRKNYLTFNLSSIFTIDLVSFYLEAVFTLV